MDIYEQAPKFTFRTKAEAADFLEHLRKFVYKFDILTLTDALHMKNESCGIGGLSVGYSRKTVKALKEQKDKGSGLWIVQLPKPGRMVRRSDGYWEVEEPENEQNGG